MDTHTIKSAAELIAALHTQPKHNYPYLVFVTKCRAADRGWYHHEDVYYWESDGEYHLDPEPEQVAEWAQHQQPARSTGHE